MFFKLVGIENGTVYLSLKDSAGKYAKLTVQNSVVQSDATLDNQVKEMAQTFADGALAGFAFKSVIAEKTLTANALAKMLVDDAGLTLRKAREICALYDEEDSFLVHGEMLTRKYFNPSAVKKIIDEIAPRVIAGTPVAVAVRGIKT